MSSKKITCRSSERKKTIIKKRNRQADTKDLTSSSKVLRVLGPNLTDASKRANDQSPVDKSILWKEMFFEEEKKHKDISVERLFNKKCIKEKKDEQQRHLVTWGLLVDWTSSSVWTLEKKMKIKKTKEQKI